MKSSELRIGNLVSLSYMTEKAFSVTIIEHYNCWLKSIEQGFNTTSIYPYVEPIPLTAEWLKKLGWKYYNGRTEGILTMDFGCKMDVDYKDGKLLIKSHYEGEDLYRDTRIKHVHQLQNLYFALTGEELTIKEETK